MAQPPSTLPSTSPTPADDPFLREVDEEVRRARIGALWKRWGALLVAAVVLLLAGLAGWLWWQDQQSKKAGVAGETLVAAIDKMAVGDNAAARPGIAELATAPGSYPALARFLAVNDALAGGDDDKAAATLEALAGDSALDPLLRDAALVRLMRLRFDALPPAEVLKRLQPLAVPGNAWFGPAGEIAVLAHMKAGQPDAAKPILIALVKDAGQAPSLRNRAAQLAISLGVDEQTLGIAAADEPAGPQAAPAPAPTPAPEGAN